MYVIWDWTNRALRIVSKTHFACGLCVMWTSNTPNLIALSRANNGETRMSFATYKFCDVSVFRASSEWLLATAKVTTGYWLAWHCSKAVIAANESLRGQQRLRCCYCRITAVPEISSHRLLLLTYIAPCLRYYSWRENFMALAGLAHCSCGRCAAVQLVCLHCRLRPSTLHQNGTTCYCYTAERAQILYGCWQLAHWF